MTHFDDPLDDDQYNEGVDTLFGQYDYEVRADGKRTSVVETDPLGRKTRTDWQYDNLGRLVDEAFDDLYDAAAPMDPAHPTDAGDYVRRFWYDLAGNRMVQQVDRAGTANDEATLAKYDANDRQLTEWSQGASSFEVGSQEWYLNTSFNQTTFFQYDNGDGNADNYDGTTQTAKRVYSGQKNSTQEPDSSMATSETTYEYNVQGRLGKVTTIEGGTTTEYEYLYDTSGTRVRQTVTVDGGPSTVTQYLVDSNNLTGYSQVLEEKDGAGTVTKTYVLGHDVLLQAASAAAYHWLVYDGHGSTRALLDEDAAIVQSAGANQLFAYTAHGELIDLSGYIGAISNALTSLLYSGEQTDGNGQQYLRARYYNAATGTFNRLDPFAGNFDDPQSLHKYLYVHGDPVNGIDPSGEILGALLGAVNSALAFATIGGAVSGAFAGFGANLAGFSTGESFSLGIQFGTANAIIIGQSKLLPGQSLTKNITFPLFNSAFAALTAVLADIAVNQFGEEEDYVSPEEIVRNGYRSFIQTYFDVAMVQLLRAHRTPEILAFSAGTSINDLADLFGDILSSSPDRDQMIDVVVNGLVDISLNFAVGVLFSEDLTVTGRNFSKFPAGLRGVKKNIQKIESVFSRVGWTKENLENALRLQFRIHAKRAIKVIIGSID